MSKELATTRDGGEIVKAGDMAPLLQLAVEKDLDVDKLERLIAMQERVDERRALRSFHDAMARFQKDCPPIKKNKTADIKTRSGSSYSYSYSTLDEIARVVNPLLAAHGLAYTWDSKTEGSVMACTCTVTHREGHSSSSTFSCPVDNSTQKSGMQNVASSLTYARRQSLVQVLGLTNCDDDRDGVEARALVETLTEEECAQVQDALSALDDKAGERRMLARFQAKAVGDIPRSAFAGVISKLSKVLTERGQ